MSRKMLKQNAVRSKNAKLKCREFSTLQKREIKMQRKISVLQWGCDVGCTTIALDKNIIHFHPIL